DGRGDVWFKGCTENSAVVHTNVCSPASLELGHSSYPFGISETCPVALPLHFARASPSYGGTLGDADARRPSVDGDEHRILEKGKGQSDREVEPRAPYLTRGPAHSRS